FMLRRLERVVAQLVVYPQNMLKNLNLTGGLVFSQRILLELPKKGLSREQSYAIVQRNAMKVWEDLQQGKPSVDSNGQSLFLQALLGDAELTAAMSSAEIVACFDTAYYTKHIDAIFARIFTKKG
ncbi:MAG: adenylosuccinate lyase, partial [Helicobacter sp.]|nr:adenylosuccinate lyase [Helicobacter sp.]